MHSLRVFSLRNNYNSFNLIGYVCGIISINAQEPSSTNFNKAKKTGYKNSLRIQPLAVLGQQIKINYERVLQHKVSLNSLISLDHDSGNLILGGSLQEYEILLEIETRYYLSKRKYDPKGWFVSGGILASYTYSNVDYLTMQDENFETLQIGGTLKTGYQWIFQKGFTIGASGGLDYRTSLSKIKNNTDGLWIN